MSYSTPCHATRPSTRLLSFQSLILLSLMMSALLTASFAYSTTQISPQAQIVSELSPAGPVGEGWSYCSKENAYCSFTGRYEVAYGQGSQFRYQTHTNGISCKAKVFASPLDARARHCWIRALETRKTITINASNPQQVITLMGGDMERSAQFLNEASNAQQIADWYYKDIAFDFARVSYDRQQELVEGSSNLAFYEPTISAMKLIQNARPDIKFWATLKSDYDGQGNMNNLPDWIYYGEGYDGGEYQPWFLNDEKYARFLADYLKHMADNDVPISVLSVAKEWISVVNANHERLVIEALKDLLTSGSYANVPMPEFSAPSSWGVSAAINFVDDALALDSFDHYSGVSTHSYDKPSKSQWADLINTSNENGKAVWHTESPSGSSGPYSGAEPPISDLLDAFSDRSTWYRQGLQGELFFENWSRGVDTESKAVYFTKGQVGVPLRAYYIIKQFANYTAHSQYLPSKITSMKGVTTMSFVKEGKLIVWVINRKDTPSRNVTFYLNGATATSNSVEGLVWFEGSSTSGNKTNVEFSSKSSFITNLEPQSIASYVFNIE